MIKILFKFDLFGDNFLFIKCVLEFRPQQKNCITNLKMKFKTNLIFLGLIGD
jgi:hypothetical protein